ncbi:MAG: hypothetical protein HY064_03800 [Bacteroidetes bacterium]|nr:hypothetical protein [Bacteroidota bacterium]
MATYELTFNRVFILTLAPNTDSSIAVPSGYVWKIESVGIGGTKGVVYLKSSSSSDDKIAILFSSIGDDDYASPLPFWLGETFTGGFFRNESGFKGSVSITEYFIKIQVL